MKRQYKSFDYLLFAMVCIVAVFGIIVIGSATHINSYGSLKLYSNQIVWFCTGLLFLLAASFIDYRFICRFYVVFYVVSLILLIAVLVQNRGSGESVARWLNIGSASIQPSEFAKIFSLIFFSKFIELNSKNISDFSKVFIVLLLAFIPVTLIIIQPSLSAGLVLLVLTLSLLYISGLNYKYIYISFLILVPLVFLFIIDISREVPFFVDKILRPYQMDRITSLLFTDTDTQNKFQTSYSIFAIASGQLYGKGLYEGTLSQLNFLVESHNDFIFAVIGEEFGFIGSVVLILILLFIILKCIYIAYKASDLLGKLLATGVASMFAFQVFVNIGVAIDILPNTGIALPLVSYGGSAMWINMISIGLVINVGMTKTKSIFEE